MKSKLLGSDTLGSLYPRKVTFKSLDQNLLNKYANGGKQL
jgi:hypothetical protein